MMRSGGWFLESHRHGLAARGIKTSYFKVKKSVVRGAIHELEHARTIKRIEKERPKVFVAAEWIADDHVREHPGYYDALAEMERRLKEKEKRGHGSFAEKSRMERYIEGVVPRERILERGTEDEAYAKGLTRLASDAKIEGSELSRAESAHQLQEIENQMIDATRRGDRTSLVGLGILQQKLIEESRAKGYFFQRGAPEDEWVSCVEDPASVQRVPVVLPSDAPGVVRGGVQVDDAGGEFLGNVLRLLPNPEFVAVKALDRDIDELSGREVSR
jgi:hypothetical protein